MEVAAVRVGVRRKEKSAFEISKSDLAHAGIQLECGQRKRDAATMAAERDLPNNLGWRRAGKIPLGRCRPIPGRRPPWVIAMVGVEQRRGRCRRYLREHKFNAKSALPMEGSVKARLLLTSAL